MKKHDHVAVEIPENDSPAWGRVGVIAIVGFVIGVAWPKLTGVKLGPNAPNESAQAAAAAASQRAPEAPREVSLSAAATQAKPQTSAQAGAASSGPVPTSVAVTVGQGAIISCKTTDGEAKKGIKECGASGFDPVAIPRLKNLAQCTAATSAQGKLSAVFTVDYAGGRMDMSIGKSSTVHEPDAFLTCMRTEFNGVVVKGLPHEHPRYVVAYGVTFEPGKEAETKPSSKPGPDVKTEVGAAQVTWETALVRDTPKTGAIVARLPRGTKVTPSVSRDGWFKITYADGEGWVYRGSIGR
jgi:hypothetical protein